MSEFEKEVERKIEQSQSIDDQLNARREAADAAKPIVFERFAERVREAAAMLVARGVQPEVEKDVVEYRQKKKWLVKQAVEEPMRTRVSGWMLATPYSSADDIRRTASDGTPIWISGTFMGTDGRPYKIVRNVEAQPIEDYGQLELSLGGYTPWEHMQLEDITEQAEALEDMVTSATARAIRGEPFNPPSAWR